MEASSVDGLSVAFSAAVLCLVNIECVEYCSQDRLDGKQALLHVFI